MKKGLSAVLAAALLLTGCTKTSDPQSSENPADTAVPIGEPVATIETITDNPPPEMPADLETEEEVPLEEDAVSEEDAPEYPNPEDYYPAMPAADEAAMADSALKAKITEAVKHSYFMELLKYGGCSTFDEEFFGDIVPEAAPKGEGSYLEVKAVSDKESLLALFREAFTENYIATFDPPLEEQLFGDIAQLYTDEGEFVDVPYFKEMDGKLLAYSTYNGVPMNPDYDGLVITSATADEICVSVAGTCLSFDNWRIGEFVLKNEGGVWKTDSFAWRGADYMGKLLSKRLSSDNLSTLGRICGSVTQTSEQGTLINDLWYYPVEKFMTIEEMRGFLKENFTDEAAALYEPYIDCFVEQDGVLYRVWEGVSCPNPKSFGSYDITRSLPRTSSYANGVEIATSLIPWNDGFGNTTEVLMVLANGKIACELPCTFAE